MVSTRPCANWMSSWSGTKRVSGEEFLSQPIRSNSGRLDGYKLPMRGNLEPLSCFMYPASVFVICTLSSHARAGESHNDCKETPGIWDIKIHSKPSSLSTEASKAMTRGTGMDVCFWTNWSVATSLAVLKYGSTGRLMRIMNDPAPSSGCNKNNLLKD